MGQSFPGGQERDVIIGQVGAEGVGSIFGLPFGGGNNESQGFFAGSLTAGGVTDCGGDVCDERGVQPGDRPDEGLGAAFGSGQLRGGNYVPVGGVPQERPAQAG